MALDITLIPLYRINGQDNPSLPGLMVQTPPQNAARVRIQDRLAVYLLLTGNATFSSSEYMQIAKDAANVFYGTSGSVTNALRAATDHVNKKLLERNMESSGRGQYANGWLTMAVMRDTQCTFSVSGPMHVYWFGRDETRHIYEPGTSGKGLGMGQNLAIYYSQVSLKAGDRMLFYGRAPTAWESTLDDAHPSSLDAIRRRLSTVTKEDLNGVLIQATEGTGVMTLLKGNAEIQEPEPEDEEPVQDVLSKLPHKQEAESTPEPIDTEAAPFETEAEDFPPLADSTPHIVQPSAYAIPPQHEENFDQPPVDNATLTNLPRNSRTREFPASIPRKSQPVIKQEAETTDEEDVPAFETNLEEIETSIPDKKKEPAPPREPSPQMRKTARVLATGIQSTRKLSESLGDRLRNFLPRLLPNTSGGDNNPATTSMMFFIAILIPLMVVTLATVVYLRYGRSEQYDAYLRQAQEMRNQAVALTNPVEQRIAWENVLQNLDQAEAHRETTETVTLRQEAIQNIDRLLGITRMQFNAAFSSKPGIDISRMAANESELFLLNAVTGDVLRAVPTGGGRGFELDTSFNCKPGVYGSYTVGPLVDILAFPGLNSLNATMLGIDASGNLLYCGAGKVGQAAPLPLPDTNWGRVTGFFLDNGRLYVLDAPSRAVWVYNGRDGTFVDSPYFFFGQQTPTQDVIDMVVSGDQLYMLHADGRLSTCLYGTGNSNTQCVDPTQKVNPFPAYHDTDLFGTSHFTQMLFAAPPDQSILLLETDTQTVMRFAPRSFELQNQIRPSAGAANPVPAGSVSAVAVSANHVLYLAMDGQVYFALNMP